MSYSQESFQAQQNYNFEEDLFQNGKDDISEEALQHTVSDILHYEGYLTKQAISQIKLYDSGISNNTQSNNNQYSSSSQKREHCKNIINNLLSSSHQENSASTQSTLFSDNQNLSSSSSNASLQSSATQSDDRNNETSNNESNNEGNTMETYQTPKTANQKSQAQVKNQYTKLVYRDIFSPLINKKDCKTYLKDYAPEVQNHYYLLIEKLCKQIEEEQEKKKKSRNSQFSIQKKEKKCKTNYFTKKLWEKISKILENKSSEDFADANILCQLLIQQREEMINEVTNRSNYSEEAIKMQIEYINDFYNNNNKLFEQKTDQKSI